jgi:hypothetical protein
MRQIRNVIVWMCCAFAMLTLRMPATAQQPMAWQPPNYVQGPDNVQGRWIISATNWDGVADTKSVVLWQNGGLITGQFRGPYQAGSLNGTVNIHHIVFRTNTRTPLTFRGRVYGNSIQGTYNVRGKQGVFNAWRQGP